MKKHVLILACLLALCLGLAACGSGSNASNNSASNEGGSSAASSAAATSSTATSNSAAAASTSAAATNSEASYELGDNTFYEAYEADGKVLYDAVAEVKNTGANTIVITDASISALDENFEELATAYPVYASPNYILPGESTYVYLDKPIELPSGCSADDAYHIQVSIDASPTNKTVTEYPTSGDKADERDGRPWVGCIVTNDTNAKSDDITVVVKYFDSNGQILGVAEHMIPYLEPGESLSVVMLEDSLPNRCSADAVANYEIHATSLN